MRAEQILGTRRARCLEAAARIAAQVLQEVILTDTFRVQLEYLQQQRHEGISIRNMHGGLAFVLASTQPLLGRGADSGVMPREFNRAGFTGATCGVCHRFERMNFG